jgi:hypothetical protein
MQQTQRADVLPTAALPVNSAAGVISSNPQTPGPTAFDAGFGTTQPANDNQRPSETQSPGPGFASFGDYTMNEEGLFCDGEQLAGSFEVVAQTTDGKGQAWGRLLRWRDRLGKCHEWAMPASMLAGDFNDAKKHLLDRGLLIYNGRGFTEKFANYLMRARPAAIARCITRTGWDGDVYVTRHSSSARQ